MDDAERRDEVTGRLTPAPEPDVVFDIETIDGSDGEHLAEQQERVMKEVIKWLARNQYERGHDNAA